MFSKMLGFEWRYFTRQPSFIVTCLVFFLLPFLAITIDQVQIGSGGNVLFNSPFAVTQILLILSVFGMFMVVNFVSGTATRNHTSLMSEIIYTKPIKPLSYNLGRFIGAYLICLTVFAMVPLGTFIGTLMPWVDGERIGPNSLMMYLQPFLIFSTTTIFVVAALFYAVTNLFRNMMAGYICALGLFILYVVAGQVFNEPEQRTIRALLDPFGLNSFREYARYWTAFEKNALMVSLDGAVLQNRLLWVAVGGFILLVGGGLFKPLNLTPNKASKKARKENASVIPKTINIAIKSTANNGFSQFITRTKFEIKQVMFSPAFAVLLLFSAFQLVASFFNINGIYGTPNWPLTQTLVQIIIGAFSLMTIIVITYYTAEVVWRERNVGMGDIVDSMPVHNVTFWLSKLIAVMLVIVSLHFVGMALAIIKQLLSGYENIEFGQYLISLLYFGVLPFCLTVVLAFLIQVLSPNKYVGMLIFVGYIFVSIVFPQIGIEHNMFNFAAAPTLQYSGLNGYGWFMQTQNWYMLYWSALAIVLSVLSYGLWKRGPQTSLKQRFSLLNYQLGTQGKSIAAVALVVFISSGAYIHYNTKVLNTFYSQDDTLNTQADYEKDFAEFRDAPIPTIVSVDAAIDIFPESRRIDANAKVKVINRTNTPITRFLVNIPQHTKAYTVDIPGGTLGEIDSKYNVGWYELSEPLAPNEERQGTITVSRYHNGFKDRGEDSTLAKNGTFIDNFTLFPSFGFNEGYRITDQHERRKRDLPPLQRAYKLEDTSRYTESFFGKGVEFIDFSATVSTSADQFAIVPGYLQKEWQENGRNYYRYEMDAPMVNFFSIMSAKLESKKVEHKGINIEVYYHKDHHWNIDRMIESSQDSLDYFQHAFGPYQHKQLRIIEFPGYRSFAQSFANTVPYSENIGFITDLRDPENIDPVYYVTAHEVAHQWWGHQLNAANVQGSAILSESLSQYSALMVMKQKYGETKLRKFLTHELDRYLQGRSAERIEEMPLLRSEGQQYIHYQKGSIVMMALVNKLGETRLNQALQALLNEYKFREDLYPTTLDLVRHLDAVSTPEEQAYIQDLFSQITIYDLQAKEISQVTDENGQTTVIFTVSAQQFAADGKGKETEQPFSQEVEIVLFSDDPNNFAADNKIIYKGLHAIESGNTTIELTVDQVPNYAGIDPFVRFIDRDTGNNIIKL
ncbi:MAG: M1 family aminopeptidase [Paraglaciecola sp.]|uniref:ABC transporter permease/M1 family aminopeptidase n=1 Tax=Paraglaciecola sp. TaxID=1920173 RepID=UPI00329752A4